MPLISGKRNRWATADSWQLLESPGIPGVGPTSGGRLLVPVSRHWWTMSAPSIGCRRAVDWPDNGRRLYWLCPYVPDHHPYTVRLCVYWLIGRLIWVVDQSPYPPSTKALSATLSMFREFVGMYILTSVVFSCFDAIAQFQHSALVVTPTFKMQNKTSFFIQFCEGCTYFRLYEEYGCLSTKC